MAKSTEPQDVAAEASNLVFSLLFFVAFVYICALALAELLCHMANSYRGRWAALRTRNNLLSRDVCVSIFVVISAIVCTLMALDFAALASSPPALPKLVVNCLCIYVVFSCAVLLMERTLAPACWVSPDQSICIPLAEIAGMAIGYALLCSATIAIQRVVFDGHPQSLWLAQSITEAEFVCLIIGAMDTKFRDLEEALDLAELTTLRDALCAVKAAILSVMSVMVVFFAILAARVRWDGTMPTFDVAVKTTINGVVSSYHITNLRTLLYGYKFRN